MFPGRLNKVVEVITGALMFPGRLNKVAEVIT